MLSPKLLEILRDSGSCARPKHGCFPAIVSGQPITRDAVEHACQKAHDRLPALSKPVTPHSLAPRLCRPPAGSRHRRAHHPVAARPSQPRDHRPTICASPPARSAPPQPARPACRVRCPSRPDARHAAVLLSGAPMDRPKLEVADVFRRYGEAYRKQHDASLSTAQRRVMTAIELCRTAALGGHVEHAITAATSASPSTPAAIGTAQSASLWPAPQWIEDRRRRTSRLRSTSTSSSRCRRDRRHRLSEQGAGLRHSLPRHRRNPAHHRRRSRSIWAPRSASSPCCTPGARTCSIIRTCIASSRRRPLAGRHALDRLPARVLPAGPGAVASVPAICSCKHLQKAFDAGQAAVLRALATLARTRRLRCAIWRPCAKTEWVVYAKPPFAGPEQVLDYVGRYTHRVAISNNRLLDIEDDQVASAGRTIAMTTDRRP